MNVILRTAQQSHPLRRGRLPAYRPVPPHPAHAFAAALAARYGRLPGARPHLGAILARPRQAGAAATSSRLAVHHHEHRHMTRLRLTFSARWRQLLSAGTPASAEAVRTGAGSDPQPTRLHFNFRSNETRAGDLLNLVLNRPVAPAATLHLEPQIVRQMLARTRRISLLRETSPPATTGTETALRAAPPVRRQVRRAAPAEMDTPPVGREQARAEEAAHRPVAQPQPVRLDNTEINRVTDHVLRTIDRQMWARRERTGRV